MLVAGAHLGAYQVQQILGRGRSGSAYLAVHLRLKHPVVIKLFPPDEASLALWESARRECLLIAQLRHDSILPVLSCSPQQLEMQATNHEMCLVTVCSYIPYPLISFLARIQSKDVQEDGIHTWKAQGARLLHIIQQASSAIGIAHAQNIAHGALVPGNFLLDDQEHLWIADFGLARLHPPATPYLAPELYAAYNACLQTRNMMPFWDAVTLMSDQYTFAIFCQQLLSRLLQRADYEQGLPALQRAMQQQPTMRFPTIEMFVAELFTLLSQGRVHTNQRGNTTQPRVNTQASQRETKGLSQEQQDHSPGSALRAWASGKTSKVTSSSDHAQDWEKLGGKHFTARDYEAAISAYQQAVALDPTRPSLWLALGDSYLASAQYTEALNAYERALKLNPNDPLVWTNRGAALDALGRHREAIMCYEQASQLGG